MPALGATKTQMFTIRPPSEFVVLQPSKSFLRYSPQVANHVIMFVDASIIIRLCKENLVEGGGHAYPP